MWFIVLLCLGARVALSASATAAEDRAKLVPDGQVQTWVQTWQQRLHLSDWKIEARVVRSTELKPETVGNLKWNSLNRTAVIKVLSPLDYELSRGDIPEDMEYTILHELVHLQLSVLPRDLGKKDIEETVVNKISDALMGMDKGPNFRARSDPAPRAPKPSGDTEASRDSGSPKK